MTRRRQFSISLAAFAKKYESRAEAIYKKSAADIGSSVVLKTPVDLGQARGGWNGAVGSVSLTETPLDKNGRDTIERIRASLSDFKVGDRLFIYNNVEHILPLENGHSTTQAPSGMVAVTLRRWNYFVNKAAQEAKNENP